MQRLSESKKLRGDGWQEKNMRQRLADYVADFLVKKGITDCFMVVGGGAMHLNDALVIRKDFTALIIIMNRHALWQQKHMRVLITELLQCV